MPASASQTRERSVLLTRSQEEYQAARPIRVGRVVRVEREDEDVREHLAGEEDGDREDQPAGHAQPPTPRRVDQMDPHERPDGDEREMLDRVQERAGERGVVFVVAVDPLGQRRDVDDRTGERIAEGLGLVEHGLRRREGLE